MSLVIVSAAIVGCRIVGGLSCCWFLLVVVVAATLADATLGELVEQIDKWLEEGLVGQKRARAFRRPAQQCLVQLQLLVAHRILVLGRNLRRGKTEVGV